MPFRADTTVAGGPSVTERQVPAVEPLQWIADRLDGALAAWRREHDRDELRRDLIALLNDLGE